MVNLEKPNDGSSNPESVNSQFSNQFNTPTTKKYLPKAIAILVLGIVSIVGCFTYGIPGLVCGIIALSRAKVATALLNADPDGYTASSIKNMKAGKTCAIIGTICSAIYILVLIIAITVGASSSLYNY